MKLADGKKGGIYTVADIKLEDNEKRRLEILGLNHGAKIEILEAKKSGSMIVKIRGTRYAIGKKFAFGILVD